jgi:hypothetical protein
MNLLTRLIAAAIVTITCSLFLAAGFASMRVLWMYGVLLGVIVGAGVGPWVGALVARAVLKRAGRTLSVPLMALGAWLGFAVEYCVVVFLVR